eukprot:TRINITY_DN7914_c0_g1_i1.p1 TRINITY_DN7914_c0_g1~~TRINITY_DN7914_c0_g1_i1.p1  ORF type:complete len:393 (+),score=49.98 TRINITY_DN7914_c0_g1_i1:380-1558(+)
MFRMRGKISAGEVATAIRENLDKEVDHIKKRIITSHAIPYSVKQVTITHIGTLDGFDEEVDSVTMTRAKALQYESELNMTLCMTDISDCLTKAYCRLRHLDTYCIRNARASIAYKISQRQTTEVSEIVEVNIRGGIQELSLVDKAQTIVRKLFARKRVRINIRLTVHPQDAVDILLYCCKVVEREARFMSSPDPIPAVAFQMLMPVFMNHGVSCVLVPLVENSPKSIYIPKEMLDEMADTMQTKQDQEFEQEVFDAGENQRGKLEEKRRQQFWGAQEDFITTKLRDHARIERHAPWSLPDTEDQILNREVQNELRAAGQEQPTFTGPTYNTTQGEHEYMSPADDERSQYGDPNAEDVELSPGPDGGRRWLDVHTKLSPGYAQGYWGESETSL